MSAANDSSSVISRTWLVCLFAALATAYVVTAVVGGFRNYCPVPFWDSWGGIVDFCLQLQDGKAPSFWAQHNEHRIFFSRVLFWLDWKYFGGTAKLLLVCNYLLVAGGWAVLLLFLKAMLPSAENRQARNLIGAVITCLTFSWIQKENLIWGFQSQFVLAQVFPLTGFYLLYRASQATPAAARLFFVSACLVGLLAAGGIISGVLALPLMTALAALLNLGHRRVAVLAMLSVGVWSAYFFDYVSPAHHGSISKVLMEQPGDFVRFLLLYLGGPLHSTVLNAPELSYFFGALVIFLSINHAQAAWPGRKTAAINLCLLTFMLHIGGTAFGTAGGRVKFGLEAALWERYMTPALAGWCVLMILAAPQIADALRSRPWRSATALLLVPLLLLPAQLRALTEDSACGTQMQAALALELGVRDNAAIKTVYPAPDEITAIARRAAERNVSVFADPRLKDAGHDFGKVRPPARSNCSGYLDAILRTEDSRYVRVSGWLFSPAAKAVPPTLHILDPTRRVVGYAITGESRPDVAKAAGSAAANAGFTGYLLAEVPTEHFILSADGVDCESGLLDLPQQRRADSPQPGQKP